MHLSEVHGKVGHFAGRRVDRLVGQVQFDVVCITAAVKIDIQAVDHSEDGIESVCFARVGEVEVDSGNGGFFSGIVYAVVVFVYEIAGSFAVDCIGGDDERNFGQIAGIYIRRKFEVVSRGFDTFAVTKYDLRFESDVDKADVLTCFYSRGDSVLDGGSVSALAVVAEQEAYFEVEVDVVKALGDHDLTGLAAEKRVAFGVGRDGDGHLLTRDVRADLNAAHRGSFVVGCDGQADRGNDRVESVDGVGGVYHDTERAERAGDRGSIGEKTRDHRTDDIVIFRDADGVEQEVGETDLIRLSGRGVLDFDRGEQLADHGNITSDRSGSGACGDLVGDVLVNGDGESVERLSKARSVESERLSAVGEVAELRIDKVVRRSAVVDIPQTEVGHAVHVEGEAERIVGAVLEHVVVDFIEKFETEVERKSDGGRVAVAALNGNFGESFSSHGRDVTARSQIGDRVVEHTDDYVPVTGSIDNRTADIADVVSVFVNVTVGFAVVLFFACDQHCHHCGNYHHYDENFPQKMRFFHNITS